MDPYSILNDYKEIRECSYKGEHYSVRDNGAVLRHARVGKPIRKNDDKWTFGRPDVSTGYMRFGSESVHRIVAFAFLGEPPTPQHVVDHIDTNRRNNRPQNLRWLTKLENALNNPITRKKIEFLCGSVEAFVNDPSMIQEFVDDNPSYEWMRTVTQEEAKASYERLCVWAAKTDGIVGDGAVGDWIYTSANHKTGEHTVDEKSLIPSLTPNAMQRLWLTPTEFPLCPSRIGNCPLTDYYDNIKKGMVVTKNQHSIHYVDDFALCEGNRLLIRAHQDNGLKKYSMITITFEDGKYVHQGTTFFAEQGALKSFALAQGLEWDGEDGIDDYC